MAPILLIRDLTYSIDRGWYAGWGTLSLINAGLAQSKNRRGWVWFLLSLFLGPIATLLIVIIDRV